MTISGIVIAAVDIHRGKTAASIRYDAIYSPFCNICTLFVDIVMLIVGTVCFMLYPIVYFVYNLWAGILYIMFGRFGFSSGHYEAS